MKVKIHTLFQYLLETTEAQPEAVLGLSLARSPTLGAFLEDLDPDLSLDWNQLSFQGLPDLRTRVIEQAGLGGQCTSDDVLITAGAAEANYLVLRQVLTPGDRVVLERPGWPQADVMAEAIGCEIVHVDRREADGWALPLDELAAAITPDTRLVFLTNPNNPTGRLIPESELRAVVQMVESVGAWLLVDEVYAGLEWSGPRPPSVAGLSPRGITTGSVSKALGLQGLRTGWLICQDRGLLMDAVILRENASEIMNVLGEKIAEVALRPDRLAAALAETRAEGRDNLDRLETFIASEPDLDWVPPEAGLIGLARVSQGNADGLARALLAPPYRTFLIPGSAYGQPDHIRLGVGGGPDVRLDEGLARLSACLEARHSA
ncbi:MAG: pyridoxal phosphate-dependent aminotransferase [Pseudomonadota bacterium]